MIRDHSVQRASTRCDATDAAVETSTMPKVPAVDRERLARLRGRARRVAGYLSAVAVVSASTLIAWFIFGESHLTDVVMVFLLGVVIVSMRFGYGPSLLAAVMSVFAFEYFFIPPIFSFAVSDLRHFVTFAVMLFVAFVISHLTKQIRDHANAAHARERDADSLYEAARDVGLAYSREALLTSAAQHAQAMFGAKLVVFLPGPDDTLSPVAPHDEAAAMSGQDTDAAETVWREQRSSGDGTVSTRSLFVPLKGSRGRVGVLALVDGRKGTSRRPLVEAFAGLMGSALERTALAEEARLARLRVETEQLRNALLSSVSHDLRTPLAVVTGATSALLEHAPEDEGKRRVLLRTAHEEALRLNRLVRNLLDMTRLEAGALNVRKELQPLEEVVGAALNRLEDRLRERDVGTRIATDLPFVPLDSVLIEQVLINVLENATKYTPAGTPIDVAADLNETEILVEIADRGPGIAKQDADRVFEKFCRLRETEGGGVGLGLTICRGIVQAHGGRMWVEERQGGGASFRFTLPLSEATSTSGSPSPQARGDREAS
jgi:two-component system sensor histidine kinase KdpD